jgi:hypothetical protein
MLLFDSKLKHIILSHGLSKTLEQQLPQDREDYCSLKDGVLIIIHQNMILDQISFL